MIKRGNYLLHDITEIQILFVETKIHWPIFIFIKDLHWAYKKQNKIISPFLGEQYESIIIKKKVNTKQSFGLKYIRLKVCSSTTSLI